MSKPDMRTIVSPQNPILVWRTTLLIRGAACLLAFCGFAVAPAFGQTVLFYFNTAGQYTGNFNPWNDNGGVNGGNYSFTESSLAGVGGGGGVSVFQSADTTAVYTSGAWDFSTNGATVIVSVLLKANGQTSANKVQLGIMNSTGNGLNNNFDVAFESFRFIPSSATVWSLREQYRTANTLTENTLGDVTVVAGHWYKFVVGLTNTSVGAASYTAGCALYDYGANGLTPGVNVVPFSTARSNSGQPDIAGIAALWPALRAFQDAGIDAWDNFLVYTTNSRPVISLPLTNTTVAAGNPASFSTFADGPGTISYSWYTNGTLVSGASGPIYETPPVDNTYSNVTVVAGNSNGSATNSAAITVFVATIPVVTNAPATGIQTTAATLNGRVVATGGDAPTVTLYYGPTDGGTAAAAWSNNVALGAQNGSFARMVTGLSPDTAYYFTARAVNVVGTAWAAPSQTFTTPALTLPVVTNLQATSIQGTAATLNGQIVSTGGDAPTVTLYYGPADGGTTESAWANNVALGVQSGSFARTLTGLSTNTTYYFTFKAVNAAGAAWATPSQTFTTPATNPASSFVSVLAQHNDNSRTGANLNETILNINNINTAQFGLVFTRAVDDQIYAQPLVMTNVIIPGKGAHNIVIVATVNDSIYAFDADDPAVNVPYWQVSFLGPGVVAPRNSDMTGACGGNYQDFSGNMGIVGTPVIDPASGTIYLVARTKENGSSFVQRLHAVDIATGAERPNSAVVIAATHPGTGAGSVGGLITFDPQKQNQRPGLALVNGVVYISWASHCDWGPYHGWVIGYDASTLEQTVVYNNTPNGFNGGIWMSGQAPAVDPDGNLYFSTGNGTVGDGGDLRNTVNRGESFLRLTRNGAALDVTSWFTPYNWQNLENGDIDLGSGGLLLIPGTTLLLSGGKQGVVYLVNRDNMGGLSESAIADTNVVQSFQVAGGSHQVHGGPVWWDGPDGSYAYLQVSADYLRQYRFDRVNGRFVLPNDAQSPNPAASGQPGGILALSANGTNAGSGIVWASHQLVGSANQQVRPGILRAYNAQNVASELWNSEEISARDSVGNFAKFVAPTVANGKVYLATFSNRLNVYGLMPLPSMSIGLAGDQAVLTWPINPYFAYTLQVRTNLFSGNWSDATNSIEATNGVLQVTVPVSGTAAFYHLKK